MDSPRSWIFTNVSIYIYIILIINMLTSATLSLQSCCCLWTACRMWICMQCHTSLDVLFLKTTRSTVAHMCRNCCYFQRSIQTSQNRKSRTTLHVGWFFRSIKTGTPFTLDHFWCFYTSIQGYQKPSRNMSFQHQQTNYLLTFGGAPNLYLPSQP